MVYFNTSNSSAPGTEYHDIKIDDPLLTKYGFTKFSLPLNDNAIKMILYNDKDPSMITYIDIDKRNLDNTVNLLKDKLLSERKIDEETAAGLGAYLRNACICRIEDQDGDFNFFKNGNGNGKAEQKKNKEKNNQNLQAQPTEKNKRQYVAYKYSNKGKGTLHEAAIIAGQPMFLKYENDELKTVEQIEEPSRIIKPPYSEEHPYESYEFANMKEVKEYSERAKSMSIDSLYTRVKQFVADYNDQDPSKLNLLSIDIIFSYFQDKFATTHYDSIVGDNDSGKSSLGITFEALAYRPVCMTDPSAANIFRCLGTIEPGQCTIILDEADKIDKSPEMMAILKTGYQLTGKVPKINTNTLRQEFFWTYGLKIIIAEKSMSLIEAKGVHDRTFSFTAYPGDSTFDIKETLNPIGEAECQKRMSELLSFRKLLLIYRLLHFKDSVANIDISLKRRSRELVKPTIQLFSNAEPHVQKEIWSTLEGFLKAKQTRKGNTIEVALYPIIANLVSQDGREVHARDIWNVIVEGNFIKGHLDEKKPNQFETEDYGTIYRNTITNVICDKLGAQKEHKEIGSVLIFDIDKLAKIGKSYDLDIGIQLKLPDENSEADGSDSSDDFSNTLTASKENDDTKITSNPSNSVKISEGNLNNIINGRIEKNESHPVTSLQPSAPSEPSVNVLGEPSTANLQQARQVSESIYRIGRSDNWACRNCRQKGDKWFMQQHLCRSSR
jgi:hypothetical protein